MKDNEKRAGSGDVSTPSDAKFSNANLPEGTEVREVGEPVDRGRTMAQGAPANAQIPNEDARRYAGTGASTEQTIEQDARDVRRRLEYLPFDESQQGASKDLRIHAESFGYAIVGKLPNSRERSLALTALEEVLTWCNKAIRAGVR